jgi:hypothetical protein
MLKKDASSVFWLSVLLGIPLYFWLWSIGAKLKTEKVKDNEIKLFIFKLCVLYPIGYLIFALYNFFTNGNFIMPLHFAAILTSLYAMIFAAKVLKSVELEREAMISEYLGDFFLICFFPIGIWILQPRIHKLINEEKSTTAQHGV